MTRRRGAGAPGQGRQPGARHRRDARQERGAADRGRPAARAGGRDPGGQRRRPRRRRGPAGWTRVRSTGCASPTPASKAWPNGLRTVAALPDPVGEVLDGSTRPNGLEITRVRVPLGVVAIIYENRPNVTSDAAGLCIKSGNAALLRGSSTALRSNIAIANVLRDALAKHGLPEDAVILVEDTSYETATAGHAAHRVRRLPDPARRPVADQERARQRQGARSSSTATATATCTSTPPPISTRR